MRRRLLWAIENFDTVLAFIISIAAAICGAFGLFSEAVVPAIAGTLTLLTISIIRDRESRGSLITETQKLGQLVQSLQSRPSADSFFSTKTSEIAFISKAKQEIWLIQETGSMVIEQNFKSLESLLRHGGKIKIIIPSNGSDIAASIARRNKNLDVPAIISRQNDALLKFQSLYRASSNFSSNLEVKRVPYPLDITAVFIDPQSSEVESREGLIRMVGFQNHFPDKRDFSIKYDKEPETYQYFADQFVGMWAIGITESIATNKQP